MTRLVALAAALVAGATVVVVATHLGGAPAPAPVAVSRALATPSPSSSPSIEPSPVPSSSPVTTAAASFQVQAYRSPAVLNDQLLFGIDAKPGALLRSPLSGTVLIHTGTDSHLPAGKVFGLMTITAADKSEVGLYFGVVDADVSFLVADKAQVTQGTPIVRIVGGGPSMFYYAGSGVRPYQVIGFWRNADGSFADASTKKPGF